MPSKLQKLMLPGSLKISLGLVIGSAVLLFSAPVFARPSIGMVMKYREGDFWAAVEQGAKEAAEAADMELIVKGVKGSEYFGPQLKLMESLADMKVDAIAVAPASPERMKAL